MKTILTVVIAVLIFAAASFGQTELEKYVGQYQVTGAPIMITVTVTGGKLAIEATGQGKAEIELVSGEDYSVKGTALTFQKDATGDGFDVIHVVAGSRGIQKFSRFK